MMRDLSDLAYKQDTTRTGDIQRMVHHFDSDSFDRVIVHPFAFVLFQTIAFAFACKASNIP